MQAVGLVGCEGLMWVAMNKEGGLACGVDGLCQHEESGGFVGAALVVVSGDGLHEDAF